MLTTIKLNNTHHINLPRPLGLSTYYELHHDAIISALEEKGVNPENMQFLQLACYMVMDSEGRMNFYYCGKKVNCFMSIKEFLDCAIKKKQPHP